MRLPVRPATSPIWRVWPPLAGEVFRRQVPGGTVAVTVHHGPYLEIASAYHVLTAWITEHGYEMAGPPREIYLSDPQTVAPEDLMTRVEFPVPRWSLRFGERL